jgi:O-antigen ligase
LKISPYVVLNTPDSIDLERRPQGELDARSWAMAAGLGATLMFAILAFGAVQEWSAFVFEAAASVLFLVWARKQWTTGQVQLSKNPLYAPALFFFVLLLAQVLLRTSAYAYITRYEVLQYISYGMVMLIAAECILAEAVRKKFALAVILFGAVYAFYALAQALTSEGKFFWFYTPRFHDTLWGSYVNRDHYAGLMEMLVPFPLVLSMGHIFHGGKRALVAFAAVLMASTIFLSGSRGGMLSFAFEVAVFGALALYQRRNSRVAVGLLAVCIFVLGLLFLVGKGQVLGRLGDLAPGIRWNITKDCLRMFSHRPVWGWGLGTFPTVYPGFRTFYTNLFVNEAHNDYAQLLVETGLLGFGLMLWFLVFLYRYGLPGPSRRWEFRWDGAVSVAALLGCTGILLHSFVDFNLQIPANAAVFYTLCALAASPLPKIAKKGRSRASRSEEDGDRPIAADNGSSLARSKESNR